MSNTPSKKIVNDMSIQFATVNGSGSQSANNIITKAIFRMGIPVGPKNLFPSNIQGLPTWYTIRVNKDGYRARKKELDWVVCMNPDTLVEDVKSVQPGGVVVYNTDILPKGYTPTRSDVSFYPVPFTTIARDKVKDVKLRKMLVNVLYVGVLSELLNIDPEVVKGVIKDTFASKPKAIDANVEAFEAGRTYARENIPKTDAYSLEKPTKNWNENLFLTEGNNLSALGCAMGGCTVVGWYPITPSSSLCESLIGYMEKYRKDADGKKLFAHVQAEDELASIGMVLGAGWAGARAMTATSGPGISLMAEFVGLGHFAEIPAVIVDVQRMGPSTGLPTRTCQSDTIKAVFLSHGDARHVALIPGTPEECYEFSRISFDVAEQLQTVVFVMLDLDIGMNIWNCSTLPYPTDNFKRGKVLDAAALEKMKDWGRYKDVDGDAIPYRTLPGTDHARAAYFTRGTGHTEYATYSEKPEDWQKNIDRLARKFETAKKYVPNSVVDDQGHKVGIIAYGTTDLCMREARDQMKKEGALDTDYLRIRAYPFNDDVKAFIEKHDRVYVIDQNRDSQMEQLLRLEYREGRITDKFRRIRHYDGMPVDARSITTSILAEEKK